MKILILGGDGYLGWPTAMHLAARGHEVMVVDNYLRRTLALQTRSESLFPNPNLEYRSDLFEKKTGHKIDVCIGDITDYEFLRTIVANFCPDGLVHYAEQPSAPYSMRGHGEAALTLKNNLMTTLNVVWSIMQECPDCQLVKLGTMGEYGTPNIDIEEGWIDLEHKGRKDRFLFPRQAGSLYHTTKIMDTDLLWFYVRMANLRVTDLMQGPVYGLATPETALNKALMPSFHYDDIFGTVINRFLVQAVAGIPLTVYGKGEQVRGYLNLNDTLQCVTLALEEPAQAGDLRIFNQFTETFSVNELAELVVHSAQGLDIPVAISHVSNPRKEAEDHYYNPMRRGLVELGFQPQKLTDEVVQDMLRVIEQYKVRIDTRIVQPRVTWDCHCSGEVN